MCEHAEGALSSAAFNLSSMPLCWVTAANNKRSVLHCGATAGTSGYSRSASQCCGDPKKDCRLPRGGSSEQTRTRNVIEQVEHTLRANIGFIFLYLRPICAGRKGCDFHFLSFDLFRFLCKRCWACLLTETRQQRAQKLGFIPSGLVSSQHFSTSRIRSKKAVATTVTTF